MGLTSQQKQAAYRERLAEKGIVPISLELPQKLVRKISAEAIAGGKTRSQLVAEKLKAKPKKPAALPAAPLPKDISKEADRIVHLIGKGLRASQSKAASKALSDAMDGIYGLAGMVASNKPRKAATPAAKRPSTSKPPARGRKKTASKKAAKKARRARS